MCIHQAINFAIVSNSIEVLIKLILNAIQTPALLQCREHKSENQKIGTSYHTNLRCYVFTNVMEYGNLSFLMLFFDHDSKFYLENVQNKSIELETIFTLVQSDLKPENRIKMFSTLLLNNNIEAITYFIEMEYKLYNSSQSDSVSEFLKLAIKKSRDDVVSLFLHKINENSSQIAPRKFHPVNDILLDNVHPLFYIMCCFNIPVKVLKLFIDSGIDLNVTDNSGNNALHMVASLQGHNEVVCLLCDSGVKFTKNTAGLTPLDIAIHARVLSTVYTILLKIEESRISLKTIGAIVLQEAVENGNLLLLELLLQHGVNPNVPCAQRSTVYQKRSILDSCISYHGSSMLLLLLKYGAKIDYMDYKINDYIAIATHSYFDSIEKIKILIEHAKKFNIEIIFNIHIVDILTVRNVNILPMLLDAGLDPNNFVVNNFVANKTTLLMHYIKKITEVKYTTFELNIFENCNLLLSYGVDPFAIENRGYSPFTYAMKKNHAQLAQLFITSESIDKNKIPQHISIANKLYSKDFLIKFLSRFSKKSVIDNLIEKLEMESIKCIILSYEYDEGSLIHKDNICKDLFELVFQQCKNDYILKKCEQLINKSV